MKTTITKMLAIVFILISVGNTSSSVFAELITVTSEDVLEIKFDVPVLPSPDNDMFFISANGSTITGYFTTITELFDGETLLGTYTEGYSQITSRWVTADSLSTIGTPQVIDFTSLLNGSIVGVTRMIINGDNSITFDSDAVRGQFGKAFSSNSFSIDSVKARILSVRLNPDLSTPPVAVPWIPFLLLDDSDSQICTDEICDDGIDNDCDDKIDCDDSDCAENEICTTFPGMAIIPSGCFNMGDAFAEGIPNERPVHNVCITSSFYMDVQEVTNAEYATCVSAGGCTAPGDSSSKTRGSYYGNPDYNDFPVIYVSWNQATDYCAWTEKRLPTEAEWEYAARGGLSDKRYSWGNTISGTDANYLDSGDPWDNDTSPVGYYAANGYGLYDMAGNVFEWVNDWYQFDYYSMSPVNDPPGPATGTERVLRGGSWDFYTTYMRVADREREGPTGLYDDLVSVALGTKYSFGGMGQFKSIALDRVSNDPVNIKPLKFDQYFIWYKKVVWQ